MLRIKFTYVDILNPDNPLNAQSPFYYATEALDYDNIFWEGRITDSFEIERFFEMESDTTNRIRSMSVTLDNHDKYFNQFVSEGKTLINNQMTLYYNDASNVTKTFTGTIISIDSFGTVITLTLREIGYDYLENNFPDAQIAYDYYSESGINDSWNCIPIHFGTVKRIPLSWVNSLMSEYMIGSGPILSVDKVYIDKEVIYDINDPNIHYKPSDDSKEIHVRIFRGTGYDADGQREYVDDEYHYEDEEPISGNLYRHTSNWGGFAYIQLFSVNDDGFETPAYPYTTEGGLGQVYVDIRGIVEVTKINGNYVYGTEMVRNPAKIIKMMFCNREFVSEAPCAIGWGYSEDDVDFAEAILDCENFGFKIDGSFDSTQVFSEALKEILHCCRGYIIEDNNLITLHIDKFHSASDIRFDEEGIYGFDCTLDEWSEDDLESHVNRIRLSYDWSQEYSKYSKKPSANHESPDWTEDSEIDYDECLKDFNDVMKIQKWNPEDVEFKMVSDCTTAHRLAAYYLRKKSMQHIRGKLTCPNVASSNLDAGDVITIRSPQFDWYGVDSVTGDVDTDGGKLFQITNISKGEEYTTIEFIEYSNDIFYYDSHNFDGSTRPQGVPSKLMAKTPLNVVCTADYYDYNQTSQCYIDGVITYDKTGQNYVTVIQIADCGTEGTTPDEGDFTTVMTIDGKNTEFRIENLQPAHIYVVRVYTKDNSYRASSPFTTSPVTMVGDLIPPPVPTVVGSVYLKTANFDITIGDYPDDLMGFEIWRNDILDTIDNPGTQIGVCYAQNGIGSFTDENVPQYDTNYYYRVRAYDRWGNYSEFTDPAIELSCPKVQVADVTHDWIVSNIFETAINVGESVDGVRFTANGIQGWHDGLNIFNLNATGPSAIGGWRIDFDKLTNGKIEINSNGMIRTSDFVSGHNGWAINEDGNAEFNNVTVRGKVKTAVFEKDEVSAVGGDILVRPATITTRDSMSEFANTETQNLYIFVEDTSLFNVGDVIRIKDGIESDLWMNVTGKTVISQEGYGPALIVAMQRTEDIFTGYRKGQSVVNYGASGSGGILLDGNAPKIDIYTHDGHPEGSADGIKVHGRLGNLNGINGISTDRQGIFFGNPDSSAQNQHYIQYTKDDGKLKIQGEVEITSGATYEKIMASGTKAVQLWYIDTHGSSSYPARPTSKITQYVDVTNEWTLAKPRPAKGYTYYYCFQYEANDNTATWSPVRRDDTSTLLASWTRSENATYIDGGSIYTGSVTANQIAAQAITSEKLAVNSILAENINVTAMKKPDGTCLRLSAKGCTTASIRQTTDASGNPVYGVKDVSGYNHHGQAYGGVSVVDDAEMGQCFVSDGAVGSYIKLANNIKLTAEITISMRVKMTASTTNKILLDLRNNNNNDGIAVARNNNGRYQMLSRTSGNSWDLYSPNNTCVIGKWQMLTCVFGESGSVMYLDGAKIAENDKTNTSTSSLPCYILRYINATGYEADCSVADVRIYLRALSATEVKTMYMLPDEDIFGQLNADLIGTNIIRASNLVMTEALITNAAQISQAVVNNLNVSGNATFQAGLNGIQVGGRNLATNTSTEKTVTTNYSDAVAPLSAYMKANFDPDAKVTLSFEAKASAARWIDFYWRGASSHAGTGFYPSFHLTTNYAKYEATGIVGDVGEIPNYLRMRQNSTEHSGAAVGATIYIKNVKLEYGTRATDWSPAPEDVEADIASGDSSTLTSAKTYADGKASTAQSNAEAAAAAALAAVTNRIYYEDTTYIDGGVIQTGSIGAEAIAANSITADKITVNSRPAGCTQYVTFEGAKDTAVGSVVPNLVNSATFKVAGTAISIYHNDSTTNGWCMTTSASKRCIQTVDSVSIPVSVTIAARWRINSSAPTTIGVMFDAAVSASSNANRLTIYVNTDRYICIDTYNSSGTKTTTVTTVRMTGGSWYNTVLCFGSGSVTIYRNGSPTGTTVTIPVREALTAGITSWGNKVSPTSDSELAGYLGYMQIFGRTLSNNEAAYISKVMHISESGIIRADRIQAGAIETRHLTADAIVGKTFATAANVGSGTSGVRFNSSGIQGFNGSTKKFDLSTTGKLTCSDVDLSGKITATSGSIGNFTLSNGMLYGSVTSDANFIGLSYENSSFRYDTTMSPGKLYEQHWTIANNTATISETAQYTYDNVYLAAGVSNNQYQSQAVLRAGYLYLKDSQNAYGTVAEIIAKSTSYTALDVTGTVLVNGSIAHGSDRDIKSDVKAVSTLNKLKQLNLFSWKYDDDKLNAKKYLKECEKFKKGELDEEPEKPLIHHGSKGNETHIGPMAQDFNELFSVNNKSKDAICDSDLVGVALRAIQELATQVDDLKRQVRLYKRILNITQEQIDTERDNRANRLLAIAQARQAKREARLLANENAVIEPIAEDEPTTEQSPTDLPTE